MHALLELDCIPSGMELFPAADEDQWSLIKGVIDECDYYILILGGRYGSIGPDGVGYTEMEYQYALDNGKPIIAFLHKDPDALPKKRTEQTEEGQEQFKTFRANVQNKMCKYWETPAELGSVVSRSLIKLQKSHPGVGWVRGNLVLDQEASLEMLELKKQIEKLNSQLEEARTKAPPGTEQLAQGSEFFYIDYRASSEFEKKYYNWSGSSQTTWDEIFYQVSPMMIHEASDAQLRESIDELVRKLEVPRLKNKKTSKGHSFYKFIIDNEDFQTIKVQLRALGLVGKSEKSRSVKDTGTYWTLTPYGDSVMNRLRAIKRD